MCKSVSWIVVSTLLIWPVAASEATLEEKLTACHRLGRVYIDINSARNKGAAQDKQKQQYRHADPTLGLSHEQILSAIDTVYAEKPISSLDFAVEQVGRCVQQVQPSLLVARARSCFAVARHSKEYLLKKQFNIPVETLLVEAEARKAGGHEENAQALTRMLIKEIYKTSLTDETVGPFVEAFFLRCVKKD